MQNKYEELHKKGLRLHNLSEDPAFAFSKNPETHIITTAPIGGAIEKFSSILPQQSAREAVRVIARIVDAASEPMHCTRISTGAKENYFSAHIRGETPQIPGKPPRPQQDFMETPEMIELTSAMHQYMRQQAEALQSYASVELNVGVGSLHLGYVNITTSIPDNPGLLHQLCEDGKRVTVALRSAPETIRLSIAHGLLDIMIQEAEQATR